MASELRTTERTGRSIIGSECRPLVAAGWRSDPGKGSSVVVASADGQTRTALPWQASFSGGQVDALATANGTVVAAGRVGYPDDDKAAVWVRPWP